MKLSATRELIMEVEEHYPTTDTKELAERLGITTNQLRHIVRVNGIRKTHEYRSNLCSKCMRETYERNKDTDKGNHWFKKGYNFRERFGDKADEMMKKSSDKLNAARRADLRRVLFGLPQRYKFKIGGGGRKRVHQRYRLRQLGYYVDKGSNVCYYDANTKRSLVLEERYLGLIFREKK